MTRRNSPTKSAGRIWIVVGIAFGIVLLAAVVAFVIYGKGQARFVAAEAAVRERGEPLHARELTFDETDASADVDDALTRLEAAVLDSPGTDEVLDLDPEALEAARAWKWGAAAWPRIEEYVKLASDEPLVTEFQGEST